MKMEIRVFTTGPTTAAEITAWLESAAPLVPIAISVIEREEERRTAVYTLFAQPAAAVMVDVETWAHAHRRIAELEKQIEIERLDRVEPKEPDA